MRSLWRVWIEAKSEEKSLRVFDAFRQAFGREALDWRIEPYPKVAGFVATFWAELESHAWNDSVVELIELAQTVGYGWILSGDIRVDPEGWSNEPRVPGVRSIQWIHGSPLTMAKTANPRADDVEGAG